MNRSTHVPRLLRALGMTILVMGCNDGAGTAPAIPGTLQIALVTPHSGLDGAAVVILAGPAAPRAITASAGLELWDDAGFTAQDTVALTGVLRTGIILTLDVDDIGVADQYRATLREVSSGDQTVALRELTGYALTVAP